MRRQISQNQLSFDMGPLKPSELSTPPTTSRRRKSSPTTSLEVSEENSQQKSSPAAPAPPSPQILTVSEITRRVASLLEQEIGDVWIEGEISNYRCQASGHHYFTLKDAGAQISCVLFARTAATLKDISLRDGMAVQIHGKVTVYQPRGQYQIVVRLVQLKGEGLLQAQFAALKQRLTAEGLFDADRKRTLPRFPQRIGVITSPTGAALADFLNILHRRHPGLQVVINPVRVQGKGAAAEIATAIEELSDSKSPLGSIDAIVITRGGGSLEDLWEFNEEIVARAIAASTIPTVSAVGHEIDFTICDFAADVRVPTPSAAAELLATDRIALLEKLNALVLHLGRETSHRIHRCAEKIFRCENSFLFQEPERLLVQLRQTLDYLSDSLNSALTRSYDHLQGRVATAMTNLRAAHPHHRLSQARESQRSLQQRLQQNLKHQHHLVKAQVERLHSSLTALNPEATLARGFTITRDEKGAVITSTQQAQKGAPLQTECADGTIHSVVSSKRTQ